MKCQATFKEHCSYPKCDCDRMSGIYVTNPVHGGKVTCHTCGDFIEEDDCIAFLDYQHRDEFPKAHFHKKCFNRYEHYYGLDKPLD